MSNISILKLVTGEEIIANCDIAETTVTLSKPIQFTVVPNPQTGEPVLAMVPYIMSLGMDTKVCIDMQHIITIQTDVPQHVENRYIQQTSGISLVNAGTPPDISSIIHG